MERRIRDVVAVAVVLAVAAAACSHAPRRHAAEAEAATSAPPAPHATTSGPPAPRVYEEAPLLAPDYPAAPGVPEGSAAGLPERFRSAFPWFGFVNRFHMADVDHHGVFVDFGTAHRFKYTLGDWAMGWSGDLRDGHDTFTWAVDDPRDGSPNANHRLYFFLGRVAAVTFQMRYRTTYRRTLTGNLNGVHGFRLVLEGGGWNVAEVPFPVEALRDGENYLQLFEDRGPAEDIGGRKGCFKVDWVWFRTEPPAANVAEVQPTDAEVLREVALRDEGGAELTRPSLALPLPTSVQYYLEVPLGPPASPTDPYIGFAYGTEAGTGGAAAATTFELGVTGEDGLRRVVWSRDVAPDAAGRWNTASSGSLGSFGGQIVRIDFSVRGRPVEGFRAIWGAPTLLVSPPPDAIDRLAETPRNVIVLLIDALRADHLEPYESPAQRAQAGARGLDVKSPALAALAGEGVVFDEAVAPEDWTLPSTASVLTGLYPLTHGVLGERDALSPEILPLQLFLQQEGFKTGAFVANGWISAPAGFDRGWDKFVNYVREARSNHAGNVLDDALAWVRANQSSPFFLYVHLTDPHAPYDPPDRFLQQYDAGAYGGPVQARDTADLIERVNAGQLVLSERDLQRLHALYAGEVTSVDEAVGRFWTGLGEAGVQQSTLLVVTSDHGEEFLEHGGVGHGRTLFDELLHVPLIVRFPGLPAPRRVPQLVSLVDLAPTIVDLLNLGPAAEAKGAPFDGNSLLPYLLGQRGAGPDVAFSGHEDDRRAAQAAGWKLVMNGPTQSALFALTGDQREALPLLPDGKWDWDGLRPLARAHPIAVRYLRILLGQFLGAPSRRDWTSGEVRDSGAREYRPAVAHFDAETTERLRALGYLR